MGRIPVVGLVVTLLFVCSLAIEVKDDGCFGAVTELGQKTVLIVGGGLAGMSAAVEVRRSLKTTISLIVSPELKAEKKGARVVLFDKSAALGGNSAKASSGINGVSTAAQKAANIQDSPAAFLKDTIESGHGLSDETLAKLLVDSSPEAIDWLNQFDLPLDVLSRCGGHSAARTHRNGPDAKGRIANAGFIITSKLAEYLQALPSGRIEILTETKMESLLTDGQGKVVGVSYSTKNSTKQIERYADSVILATGGYSRGPELLVEFAPQLASFPSTNGPFANGDGVKAARYIGAKLNLMDQIQLHPTGLVDPKTPTAPTKILGPEALRSSGGLIVNNKGERFVNELGLRDHVSKAIIAQDLHFEDLRGNFFAYLFLNQAAIKIFQEQVFSFYQSRGLVQKFENAKDAATKLGFDVATFEKTITDYAEAAKANTADAFGKTFFPVTFDTDEALYLVYITPSIHYTMGGVQIDSQTRVLAAATGKPIEGLFAAGEVTGGLHGANRLAGNSLLECVVFGRISGVQAAGDAKIEHVENLSGAFGEIQAIVGPKRFTTRSGARLTHARDHSYHNPRMPDGVVWPLTDAEVAAVVKVCHQHKIPVIPYGVGSSLEGHTIALHGGVVMNMTGMASLVEYHEGDQQVVVQAGIRRVELNNLLKDKGVFFPIDPGADASIGGMAATGASGTLAVGYGTMRENIIRLKVVTPTGEIFYTSSRAKKSSAGYDLTHLFIGSEGTLGVITEITLKVYKIPVSAAAVCSFPTFESATKALIKAKATNVGGHRMELLNQMAIEAVNKKFNRTYSSSPKLFLEFHGANEDEVVRRANEFERVAKEFGVFEFAVATAEKERNDLWQARHGAYWAAASLCQNCKLFVTDVCVPVSRLAECVVQTSEDFEKSSFGIPPILGHAGDGNFHVMLPVNVNDAKQMALANELNRKMVLRAIEMDGTCTGEHGVGYGKAPFVHIERGETAIEMMKMIKASIDPHNIMNPGKIW